MTRDQIKQEGENFFEWDDPKNKHYVTTTSCFFFAERIADMTRQEYSERLQAVESVFSKIADYVGVKKGDVVGLLEAIKEAVEALNKDKAV